MTNFLEEAVHMAEGFIDRLVKDVFGSGSGSDGQLTDIRWEGMNNAQLAHVVTLLSQGPGASAMTQAADALANIAQSLQQLDHTLQQQLQAIGINWQSSASDLAQEMTTASAAYGGTATNAGSQAGTSMGNQGEAYSSAKNAAGCPQDLNPGSSSQSAQQFLTGHATDALQAMKNGLAARNKTIDALNNYTQSSQSNLNSYQPLPAPPGVNLTTTGVDTGLTQVTSVSSFTGSGPTAPGMSAGAPAGTGLPGSPAGGGSSGPMPQFPGMPGGGMPGSPSPVPGVPTGGGTGPITGPVTGIGAPPPIPGTIGPIPAANAGSSLGPLIEDAAIGTTIAGGSVAAGVAASQGGERVGRPSTGGVFGEGEEGDRAGRQASSALAELDEEDAAAAQASARIGATAEADVPMLMQPAVGGRPGEDDAEHTNRYAADDEDMFRDDRMVAPPVLGSDTEPEPPRRPDPSSD